MGLTIIYHQIHFMTRADILKLQASGKIRGHNLGKIESDPEKKVKLPHIPLKSKAKDYIELNLQYWCNDHEVTLEREKMFNQVSGIKIFDPTRKWRFDWFISAYKIAIEFEGLTHHKSGHTTNKSYTGNTDKYNAAAAAGIIVLRFTFMNYTSLTTELNKCISTNNLKF